MLVSAVFLAISLAQPALATYTKMHDLSTNFADGAYPVGQLANNGGVIYGFTQYGVNGSGSFFKMTTAGTVTTIKEFAGGAGNPSYPNAGPVVANATTFYGTSLYGGTSGLGTVFSITTTGTIVILHSFTGGVADGQYCYAGVTIGSDGKLYGTTINGGTKNQGTVWSMTTTGGSFTVIHSFDATVDAYYPYMGVTEASDGMLYGTVYYAAGFNGGVYRLTKDGVTYSFLHGFSGGDPAGYYPFSDLARANDGKLYGTCIYGGANGLGTIFKVDPGSGSVTAAWAFDGYTGAFPSWSYGTNPQNRMTVGTGNLLYGVTHEGGMNGFGAIFKFDTSSTTATLVASLTQTTANTYPNPLLLIGTTLYGTSFYGGTTAAGGPNGWGSAFSSTTSGTFKALHTFYVRDLRNPGDSQIIISGYGYGTALYGGQFDQGAVYKINVASPFSYSVLHSFNNGFSEGYYPYAGLYKGVDGALYGSTYAGGAYGGGTIFKMTTAGVITILHHFRQGLEGWDCYRKLVQGYGNDKNLYGTCYQGGPSGFGSAFKISTAGVFSVIHYFNNLDGRYPGSQLTVEPDTGLNTTKALYGATYQGGANNLGTLFKLNATGSTFAVLHDFATATGNYGAYFGGGIPLVSGVLYGTTYAGGAFSNGVFYKYDLATNTYTDIHDFNNAALEGYYPYGGLSMDTSGNFYGTNTYGGTIGYGTIWKFNPSTSTFTKLHDFLGQPSDDGANPYGGVQYDSVTGLLFGTTYYGGSNNNGQIFNQTTVP